MSLSFTRTLHNGIEIPFPGFDLSALNDADSSNAVYESLQNGCRHFYMQFPDPKESSLIQTAEKLGLSRKDLFLTYAVTMEQKNDDQLMHDINIRLRHLQSGYADLLLIGWNGGEDPADQNNAFADGAWRIAEELFKQARARAIGVSGFSAWQIEYLLQKSEIAPMAIMFQVYPGHASEDLLHSCKDHNALALCHLRQSSGKLNDCQEIAILARKHQCTPQDIVLQYQLQKKCSPIIYKRPDTVNPPYITLDESEMLYLDHMKDYLA